MNSLLQGLRSCRVELVSRLANIDGQISFELDRLDNSNAPEARLPVSPTGAISEESKQTADGTVSKRKYSARGSKKATKAPRKKRNQGETWSAKILSVISKAEGRGLSSGEIVKAVIAAEQNEGRSAKSSTINATLQAMETKSKRIRVERGATGRKLHFVLDTSAATDNSATQTT